jgi:hypothetical protein
MQHLKSAGLPPAHAPFARGIRGAAAVLITLVAPVISMSGALTTGLKGTSPRSGSRPATGPPWPQQSRPPRSPPSWPRSSPGATP